ncbi:MAG: hypothetical protein KIT72_07135 [Polyangiaceae bacterium]|nr:hypothetical protein [Polyangiaceae bacterium]MCW5790177.1 hypothetical protein [Polyangiaceae bacterium]
MQHYLLLARRGEPKPELTEERQLAGLASFAEQLQAEERLVWASRLVNEPLKVRKSADRLVIDSLTVESRQLVIAAFVICANHLSEVTQLTGRGSSLALGVEFEVREATTFPEPGGPLDDAG